MKVLVTYDVATADPAGRRRLARVAKTCLDYGQRVQYSVFECSVTPEQWVELRHRLIDEINQDQDSLRFYMLGKHWQRRVEHVGAKPVVDLEGPLII